jgi:hypothetical protein
LIAENCRKYVFLSTTFHGWQTSCFHHR